MPCLTPYNRNDKMPNKMSAREREQFRKELYEAEIKRREENRQKIVEKKKKAKRFKTKNGVDE
jgi:hypothetical protein